MIGDGIISISQDNSKHGHGLKGYIGICGDPKDKVVDHIEEFMNSLGYNLRTLQEKENCITRIVTNSEMAKIAYDTLQLGDMSADYKKKNLKIPDYILNSTLNNKIAFIAGLLDTDGYLKSNNGKADVTFCSKDFRLSTGLVSLFRSIGVESSYILSYNKTYDRNYYIVRVTRSGSRRLNFLGLHKYLVCDRKIKAIVDMKDFKSTRKSSMAKVRVLGVEFLGETKEVFDIRVANESSFFANGILVHNCLGIPYGMEGYALGKSLEVPQKEAEKLIKGYLDGFPELKKWMTSSNLKAQMEGFVQSEIGRIRHLPEVKELYAKYGNKLKNWKFRKSLEKTIDREDIKKMAGLYKNGLNNAKNFQIQSLGASIVNLAMIKINKYFTENEINGRVICTVHDQIICEVPEKIAKEIAPEIEKIMASCYELSIKLKAPAEIGYNWRDTH